MDTNYASLLTDKIAESIIEAAGKTRKAQVGWAFDLVQRLESKELPTAALDPTNRSRLIKHDSERIREIAEKVFDAASSNRMSVLNSYRSALTLTGDAEQGRQVITKACAVCHQRGSEGRAIGPNMASVIEHSPEKLLGSILDPSADIQPGFNAYNCLLHSGELAMAFAPRKQTLSFTPVVQRR